MIHFSAGSNDLFYVTPARFPEPFLFYRPFPALQSFFGMCILILQERDCCKTSETLPRKEHAVIWRTV
jgi:hypothetical protein